MSSTGSERKRSSSPASTSLSPPRTDNHNLGLRKIYEEKYAFEGWDITVLKSPILPSVCYCIVGSSTVSKSSSETTIIVPNQPRVVLSPPGTLCQVCRFDRELSLRHLPEMVFPDNVLRLVYLSTSFVLEFSTLESMKSISTTSCPLHVACSDEWKASKALTGLPTGEALEPYDWTYSTNYKGTLRVELDSDENNAQPLISENSSVRLNIEKLKIQEKILFFEEIPLYEDELHDNGISNLTVKLRVMPSGFFILLRFFLRVDQVVARLSDTRVHFESGNDYIIRQVQSREGSYESLAHLQPNILTDPNALYSHLPIISETNEKISLTSLA